MGELAETTPLLRVRILTGTEGSNPSVSAITKTAYTALDQKVSTNNFHKLLITSFSPFLIDLGIHIVSHIVRQIKIQYVPFMYLCVLSVSPDLYIDGL